MHKGYELLVSGTFLLAAFSSSTNYQLQDYGVGSGGTNSATSPTYKLNANTGQTSGGAATGGTITNKSGQTEVRQANVPNAPTLGNGSGTYSNKLDYTINKGGNDASDYTYSIAISSDNFVTTLYVQADGTLGVTPVYRSYVAWGGATGSQIIGLSGNTTYKVKVNAMQGTFTGSQYGPVASSNTINPSLSFSVSPGSISLGSLTPGSVISGGSNLSFTFATNAASGGAIYVKGQYAGLFSTAANYTISAVNADLTTQGQGFGLRGSGVSQTSGGPLVIASPFNGSSNTVGAASSTYQQLVTSGASVIGGAANAVVLGKSSFNTPSAGDYQEVLTFVAAANF